MASPSRLPAARRPAAASSAKARPMSMFDIPTEHLKRPQQIGDGNGSSSDKSSVEGGATSKQSKRRSLLPTFSRKTPTEDEKETVSTIREDTSDSEVSVSLGAKEDKKSMAPPPKPIRPTSMRAPGAMAPARTTSLHAKTSSKVANATPRSTVASSTQKSDQGLRRSGSTKLPHGSKLSAPTSTQQAIPTRGSSARATTSTTAQKRSSEVLSKAPVLEPSSDPHAPQSATAPSPIHSTISRPSTRGHTTSTSTSSKPGFSTYQQHYSPAKSALPKPPIPSAKPGAAVRPPTATGGEGELPITAEVALEQIELLQLSLMHRSSEQGVAEYEASARQKLEKLFKKSKKDYESIRAYELGQRRLRNLSAIETWCPDHGLLAEHLQTLNRVVTALRTHTDPESRYSELSDTFDAWATKAEASLFNDTESASFIEALPEPWRAASLALKLRSIQRDLYTLPPLDAPSSLQNIMDSCSSLVDDMLKSLEIMTKLQKEVLQRSKARIDEHINALVSSGTDGEKENWVPAWTSVS